MCRHVLYLGPPETLASVLSEPAHSLLRQSWAPRDMRGGGTINADGFGAGWQTAAGLTRYRRAIPMWSDENFDALARTITSPVILAAVRNATEGMSYGDNACAPFGDSQWLFSHNGKVTGWPDSIAKLAAALPVTALLTLAAPTDAALLWALVQHQLANGGSPGAALACVTSEVSAAAPGSKLNLLLTDGTTGYATAFGHSLWLRHTPGRLIIASEPLDDDPQWLPVPENHLLTGDVTGYTPEEL